MFNLGQLLNENFYARSTHSDIRKIIIEQVRICPQVGKEMNVVRTTLSPAGGNKVNVSCHVRTSIRVTKITPLDGCRIFEVHTESGRIYIVEVM